MKVVLLIISHSVFYRTVPNNNLIQNTTKFVKPKPNKTSRVCLFLKRLERSMKIVT